MAVASGRASSRSYLSRRTSTPGTRATRTETATAPTTEEPSYMVALIENRAREVGLALYRLRSFHVELRQFCDSNSFSTTLAALAVSAYVGRVTGVASCATRHAFFFCMLGRVWLCRQGSTTRPCPCGSRYVLRTDDSLCRCATNLRILLRWWSSG